MKKIIKNAGIIDRITRGVIGSNFMIFSFFKLEGLALILAFILGAILLISSITGYCAAYNACGITTRKDWE